MSALVLERFWDWRARRFQEAGLGGYWPLYGCCSAVSWFVRRHQLEPEDEHSRVLMGGYYPRISLRSVICCELMSMDKETEKKAGARFGGGPANRRDLWPSREEAYRYLKVRGMWKTWDDRVLRNYVVGFSSVDDQKTGAHRIYLPGKGPKADKTWGQWRWSDSEMLQSPRNGKSVYRAS